MKNLNNNIQISRSGLMDLESAAAYLGATVGTMRWLRRMKKLPFVKIGAKLMVRQIDIDAYISANIEPAQTE